MTLIKLGAVIKKYKIIIFKQEFKVESIKHHDKSIFNDIEAMLDYAKSLGIHVTIEDGPLDYANLPELYVKWTMTKDIEAIWKIYLSTICINLGYDLSLVQDRLDQDRRDIITDDRLIKLNETIDSIRK